MKTSLSQRVQERAAGVPPVRHPAEYDPVLVKIADARDAVRPSVLEEAKRLAAVENALRCG